MRHVRREELMKNAVAIEAKDAGATLSPELKGLLGEFTKVAMDVKAVMDERVSGLEKKIDPLIEEKAAKATKDLENLRDEFNKKFAEMTRAGAGGSDADDEDAIERKLSKLRGIEKKAFGQYIRKDDKAAMAQAIAEANKDEYKSVLEYYRDETGLDIKDLSTVVAEDGGFLVLPEYERQLDEILLETSPMRQVANVRAIGTRELIIPVNRKGTTVAWIGETDTRSATATPTISQQKFAANELYAYPLVTLAMLEDADFDVEGWLNDEVAEALMIEENTQFVTGDGNGKPLGFLSSTITKVANSSYNANTNWGSVAYIATGTAGDFGPSYPGASPSTAASNGADALFDLAYALKARFRQNASWLMSRLSMGRVRKLKDGQGEYVIKDAITANGLVPMLLGYPVWEAEDMPAFATNAYPIAFGDWDKAYQIVDRIGLQVRRDEVTQPGYVKYHFRKRTGGGVRNWDAYKLLKAGTS